MWSEPVLFWFSVILLGYTYLGYPALIWLWARFCPRLPELRDFQPMVSLIVVAHDEATRIRGRIENLLALDYPRNRLEIFLASDGSTDGTGEVARPYEGAGIKVFTFAHRRGKPAVLNEVVSRARGDLVVLADARQRFDAGALRALVRPFSDPDVGAASGELILNDNGRGTAVGEGVGFYWRYEKFIRRNESRVDSCVGATGAIYAVRRELWEPIPEDTLLDDVWVPLRISRRGYRLFFESGARAYDRAAVTAAEEFARKVRTIAGTFQLFARERWLLSPLRNRLWLQTLSHKALRLLTPFLLSAAFAANLLLLDMSFYRWAFCGQLAFYAAALGGYALRNSRSKIPVLSVPYVLCLLSWATLVALFRFVTERQAVTWEQPTQDRAGRATHTEDELHNGKKPWQANGSCPRNVEDHFFQET